MNVLNDKVTHAQGTFLDDFFARDDAFFALPASTFLTPTKRSATSEPRALFRLRLFPLAEIVMDIRKLTGTAGEPASLAFTAEDHRYAYAVARRIVRDEQDAHDVAQDALLLAFRYRHSFRGQATPRTWFHRIVITTALSHLRSSARRRRHHETLSMQPTSPQLTPEQALNKREQEQRVAAHVQRLCEKYRSVISLRIEDLSDAEIAERLAISVGSVKVRSHRARHQLREALAA
jgi:RNA polymerase sigma-70 factor (ECF subfamily)